MKNIPITPEIERRIKAVAGEDVNIQGLVVFEAIALNTRPLPGKPGTLFDSAVVTPLTLREMADYINTNGLPLAEDHISEGAALGKIFYGEFRTVTETASMYGELRVLLYLDETETARITKINAGVIDETSVSFSGKALLCSECGWDYMSEESDPYDNLYLQKCSNGHEIGVEGTHLIVSGLKRFTEISLVQLGAASKAKIVGKSASTLSPQSLAIAASNYEADTLTIQASAGDNKVDIEVLMAKLTTATSAEAVAKSELTRAQSDLLAANAALEAAVARVSELEAAAADPTLATELSAAREVLTAQFVALAVASGETDPEAPTEVAALKAGIESRTASLTALIPVGGAAQGAGEGDNPKKPKFNASAFKTSK